MDPNNQTYATLKEYMLQVFELRLQMGAPGEQNTSYNATYTSTDNDSIGTITESIQNMQMANNAAAHSINENMSTITCENTDLRNIIGQMRREQANFSYATWVPTPPTQYTPVRSPTNLRN